MNTNQTKNGNPWEIGEAQARARLLNQNQIETDKKMTLDQKIKLIIIIAVTAILSIIGLACSLMTAVKYETLYQ